MRKTFAQSLVTISILLLIGPSLAFGQSAKKNWQEVLKAKMKTIENSQFKDTIGLYVKNLRTEKEFSYNAEEPWYIASVVKLPVALEVLRQVDVGLLSLETKVEVLESDYIDGAGELNYIKPGSKVSIRLLLDQALTFSDNTAADILIRLVGLENVNNLVQTFSPKSFAPITTLAEVRRQAYSQFHPNAQAISNKDFIKIRVLKTEAAKLERLSQLLKVPTSDFKNPNLDSAFEAYYLKRQNSANLKGIGVLLEKLSQGAILKDKTRSYLMNILDRVETGQNRIKAGLPKGYSFAHKTGTQHRRFCDVGIMTNGMPASDELVVVACVRKVSLEEAEKLMKKVGQSLNESGIFSREAK